jgi:flagellar biosynthesis protein FlhA
VKWIKSSIVSIGVIGIILMIILPLPTWALDFLLMINLSLALTVLLTAMNSRNALQFSIFPSLLLLTTLLRLALEISATKLILGNGGNAGAVIRTFGGFVIQNNIVVGLVVFLIIVVVQFIVITKGSERVAEVAARFTLDAMPGKQMAIDADLNSGLVTEEVARKRRSDVQREADFYGAMDGASKFVKGDAIVAIVIIIINIAGGMISGMINGDAINVVIKTYTMATVGEGLMAQLPALLISTATGIIVTRAASDGNMSTELVGQLFSQPVVLRTTGAVLLFMLVIPGFPWPILILIGGMFMALSFTTGAQKKQDQKTIEAQTTKKLIAANSELERLKNPENIYLYLEVETIEMEFGYSLIPLVDEQQGGSFVDKVVMFRRQFAMDTGIVIPSVRMRDNIQLANNKYLIKIRGEGVASGELLVGNLLVMNPASDKFAIDGVDTVEPAFGLKARWIPADRREDAEMAGYTVIEPAAVMMTHLAEVVRRHANELLGRREVNSLLDMVKKNNASLVDEVIPAKFSVGDLQKVLQNLLREEIPIRDMVTILETVSDYSAKIKDTDMMTEFVRQSLKRTISHKLAPEGELKVITIDPQVEKMITASIRHTEQGAYLTLEPDRAQSIIDNISATVDRFSELGLEPVILVSPAIRMYFKRLTEQVIPQLMVVSYSELENNVKVQAVSAIAA